MNRQTLLKKKLLVTLITTAIASGGFVPSIVWSQSSDATLRGKAPAKAAVTAKNIATGSVRRTNASDDGSYTIVGLQPGTYQVDAGPGTEKTVTLTVASTASLDIGAPDVTSTATTTLEGVVVTAQTLTEVKTSEVGNTVSLHQIQTVPQITRNFLEFADTVPGMVFSVDSAGHTSLKGGGQSADSTNVYIDGVGQKNYVKKGGVGGQFNSQGNPFPQLAIGEYKIITSNYKAEYDQISGAAITAETKSGTNEFHGELFNTYTDQDWRAKTPSELNAGKQTPSQEKEYGLAFGGPIIQDTLHFFFTYEAKRYDTPITVVPGVDNTLAGTNVRTLLPESVVSQFGPADLPFIEDLYFGKLDWEFSDRDRIEVSAKVRREDQADNIGTSNPKSASTLVKNNDDRIDARWQHSADHWFNELLFTHEKTFNQPSALNTGNGADYFTPAQNSDDGSLIVNTAAASPLATQNKGQKGPSIEDNLTFSDLSWMGDHTVKMGAKFKKIDLTAQDAGLSNPQFYYNVTEDGTSPTPFKAVFTNPVPGLSPVATSSSKQFGVYVQDDWAVNDKLTLNLGVRWDYEETPSYLDYVTPANVVAALYGPNTNADAPPGQTYAQALALGGVDVADYISNGHNRKAPKDNFQPRLGFSYDFNGDEEHVLFGGAGRSYDRNLYDTIQIEQTRSTLPISNVYFNTPDHPCPGTGTCVDWDPNFLNGVDNLRALINSTNGGSEVYLNNNNLKTPYSDQFSLGIRNKVGDWNTSAAVARILSKDGVVFSLGHRYPDGAFWVGGSQPWGQGLPGFGNMIISNNGLETKTTQLLLSADKPYTRDSGWGASFAYTYTDAKQNRAIDDCCAFDGATIGDYPFIRSDSVAKHRFVATGSIDGPGGFIFSGKATLATPIPHSQFECYADNVGLFPSGSHCLPIAATPDGQSVGVGGKIFGYRSIDLTATKNFDMTEGLILYVRFDFLNVFNFKNLSDYTNLPSGAFRDSEVEYNSVGNITGVPRTMKVTAGFRF